MSRRQILVLFVLIALIGVLAFVALVYNPEGPNADNITPGAPGTTLVDTLEERFQESAVETGSSEILSGGLTFAERAELAGNLEPTDLLTGGLGYTPLADDLLLYDGPIEDIAVFLPGSAGTYDDVTVNRWEDGATVYSRQQFGEADFQPLLRKALDTENLRRTYLVQDEVHLYLGPDIVNVYRVQVEGNEYWISFILTRTGYAQMYFSAPYFRALTPIPGVLGDGSTGFVNGRYLTLTTPIFEGDPYLLTERIDVQALAEAPIQDDYSEYVESTREE